MTLTRLFVLMLGLGAYAAASTASPAELPSRTLVTTEAGVLAGAHGEVSTFFGIPFAAPPVGDLRWRAPQPVEPWTGVREAVRFSPSPIQWGGENRSEDCLYLNVWTPDIKPTQPLPVMVWIYGGGFVSGSGSSPETDGTRLARRGVVVVSLNYRVGLLGFAAHPLLSAESPTHSSGNYGLMDQVAALRWVKANIKAFGGDTQRITVFGESAGGSSLSMLLISPHARGLFQRAILQSPGSMRPLNTLSVAEKLGGILGDDLATMRALPAAELLQRASELVPRVRSLTRPRALGPFMDGDVIAHPGERAAFAAGAVNPVDLLIGSNEDEGISFVENWPITTVEAYHRFLAENFGAQAEAAFACYPARGDSEVKAALSAVFMDTQFVQGIRGMAHGMAALGKNVYRYHFTRHPGGRAGAPRHAEEVRYVFGTLENSEAGSYEKTDRQLSELMQAAWVRFASTGDPNGPGLPLWPRHATAGDPLMVLGDTAQAGVEGRTRELDFVEQFLRSARP